MHAIAIQLPWSHFRKIDMPHLIGTFNKGQAMRFLLVMRHIKQTQIHSRRIFREEGKIYPFTIPRRP
jgi:hypothetical protein